MGSRKVALVTGAAPEEFGHVIRFLAHSLAGFITGEVIDQNGGLHFD